MAFRVQYDEANKCNNIYLDTVFSFDDFKIVPPKNIVSLRFRESTEIVITN